MSSSLLRALVLGAALLVSGNSFADDWQADKLRGHVLQLVDGQWQPLVRGDVVSDDRVIRTLASGYVEFTRGGETVNLGPNTQIQIHDEGGVKPFTTVQQYFGAVSVEAQVENVQHFAVQTPFLAAVVKGTMFTVTSGEHGASVVVDRGHVAVVDYSTRDKTTISVGQKASVGDDHEGISVTNSMKKSSAIGVVMKPQTAPTFTPPLDPSAIVAAPDTGETVSDPNSSSDESDQGEDDDTGHGNGHAYGHGEGNGNSANAPGHNKSGKSD